MLCTLIVLIPMSRVCVLHNKYLIHFFLSEEFVLPREEARRLFRAYNHVWDLKIDENRVQQVFDACARNGRVVIDEALKQLAK
jgi:hypothetical protein